MRNARFTYKGPKTREISFPLGGIGTGCVGLAGNGRLVDWEIFNKPAKGSTLGFSHFAVRAEAGGEVLDRRILHGDLQPPYSGELSQLQWNSFGFGPPRAWMAGMPHFREARFTGTFPIAMIAFRDPGFPGTVKLTAFNPMIPMDEEDSGIPAAFFEVEFANTGSRTMDYTVALSLQNPFPKAAPVNRFEKRGSVSLISLRSQSVPADDPAFGDLTAATDAAEASFQEYWYRGAWFDNLGIYWADLGKGGRFANRTYPPNDSMAEGYGRQDHCLLAAHLSVAPGKRGKARFLVSWSFPNRVNDWNPEKLPEGRTPRSWKNRYAMTFRDSTETAVYAMAHWKRLWKATRAFRDALFGSTLPEEVLDAVSANLSLLKSPTVMRLEDGTFYGFEGCHPDRGCCEGSCTHVWNYAYALPFLFPRLERSMRDADFAYNCGPEGGMAFRLQLPLGRERSSFRPCADGQFGGVVKAYRDWKMCGDDAWMARLWPAVKRSLSFAWSEANPDRWDADRDGVLEGRQHHTLDMELFGPNSWLTGMYLAALKAASLMAGHLGDGEAARDYADLFARGKAWTDANLFNGEYYQQKIDLKDRSILERYAAAEAYWDEEHGEIKYQVGDGCAVDQALAQWHANLCGLGEIFDPDRTASALKAVYRHNFKKGMRDFPNPCRVFCLNDEAGLVICSYPRSRPAVGAPYAEETMHGFEYQAACHMIQEGMVEEGLEIVTAVRDRYDGEKRNPWNEIECGSNYARSMASYALLPALSGFSFDMTRGFLGFDPRIHRDAFRCLWALGTGWGVFRMESGRAVLEVLGGSVTLREFSSGAFRTAAPRTVTRGGAAVGFRWDPAAETIGFDDPLTVLPGKALEIGR